MSNKMNIVRFKTLFDKLDEALKVTERIVDNSPQHSSHAALARELGVRLDEMMMMLGDVLQEAEDEP